MGVQKERKSTFLISVTHTLAPPNDSNKNPAINVKFLSQKLRDTIYHKRWKVKDINNKTGNDGFKAFINESLTKANKDVFKVSIRFLCCTICC